MNSKNPLLLLVLLAITLFSCEKEPDPQPIEVTFDLTGAKAILFSEAGETTTGSSGNTTSNIFKVDDNGNVTPVAEGIKVTFAKAFSGGVYLVVDDPAQETPRNFYVRMDNTFTEITDGVGTYKGENENGDIVFLSGSVLRKATLQVEKLQTTLNNPTVQSISGNLAILTDNSTFQIYNTVSGVRYNVAGCNGPRMVAFSDDKAIVDDCSNKILMDMTDGTRTEGDISGWNQEAVRVGDEIAILSQSLGNDNGYYLGMIDDQGTVSLLSDYAFSPGSSSCMNCGDPNTILFNSGDNFVVKELNKVTVVTLGDPTPKTILQGYNVTSISVIDDVVYYLAEDNVGAAVTGAYNLTTESNQILSDDFTFDEVQSLN